MTEKELVESVFPHREAMYRIAFAITGDEDDASEAVQQVIVAVWEGNNDETVVNWKSYCMRSVRNRALSISQKRTVSLDSTDVAENDFPVFQDSFENRQELDRIKSIIDSLPGRQREVISMSVFGGLDNDEIAAATGLEDGNIRQALSRARKALRNALKM